MACDPCQTPVTGQKSLPASQQAYLIDAEVCSDPLDAGSSANCNLVTEPSFNVTCSGKKNFSDYIPGWVSKLLPSRKGRMLLAGGTFGDSVRYLENPIEGPVQYADGDIHVGYQQQAGHLAGDGAIVEDGYLPLAFLDKEVKADENGVVEETEVYRHGVQQVRKVGVGDMLGLSHDAQKGTVRQDTLEPTEYDLVKKGIPEGLRRLAFRIKEVESSCGFQKVKEWYSVIGAAFSSEEIIEDKTGYGLEPSLIPTDSGFVIARRDIQDRDSAVTNLEASEYRLAIAKVKVDPENSEKIIGFDKEFLPFPTILEEGIYEDIISRIEALESP